jgi:ABC-type branched-subunit amino acid transport system substrate-binding protein
VALNERLSYWGSPPVRINVEEMLFDYSGYIDWRRDLPMQVKIGVVFSDFLNWGDQIVRFAEDDINEYCLNMDAHYDFEFIRTSGGNDPEQHQQAVQMFDELGLNLLIGGYLSHQVPNSLDYVNERNMLLVSPSSTSHMLSIPYDNFFRLSPPNTYEGRVIAEMVASRGISAVVFLLLEDEHIVSLAESIKWELDQIPGCDFYDAIGYNRELENIEDQLELANIRIGDANVEYSGAENVALIYLGFEEIVNIVEIIEAEVFSNLLDTKWFCSSDQVFNDDLTHVFLGEAEEPILFVPYARPNESNWTLLSERYFDATGGNLSRSFSFMIANEYDACWLYAKAILDTGTMNTEAINAWIYENASTYHGVSGPLNLDENGDRTEVVYDIWCIELIEWTTTGNWTEVDGAIWN